MNKSKLKTHFEKLLEQLNQEDDNVFRFYLDRFGVYTENWTASQNEEYLKIMARLWDAEESLKSVIDSLEELK